MNRLAKLVSKARAKDDDWLIEVHHTLMKEYGWIPLEEFKRLPIPTLYNLLYLIKRDREEAKKKQK